MRRLPWALVLAACLGPTLAACRAGTSTPPGNALGDGAITVASFDFPESRALAELYAQALEGRGFRVQREPALGPRELVEPALERGLVELVPEYAGSALAFLGGSPTSDDDLTHQLLEDALASRDLTALDAAPAQDRNTFAMLASAAASLGVRSISDLAGHAGSMAFGGPTECEQRTLCLKGLEDVYGLRFERFVTLDAGGPLTVQALVGGTVDVGLVFSSDPALDRGDLIELRDDEHLEPAENVTPVLARATVDRFGPTLTDALDAVSADLTTADLRAMNAAMLAGRSPWYVAHAWLVAHGFAVAPG